MSALKLHEEMSTVACKSSSVSRGQNLLFLKAHDQANVHKTYVQQNNVNTFPYFQAGSHNVMYTSQHARIFQSVHHYFVIHLSPFLPALYLIDANRKSEHSYSMRPPTETSEPQRKFILKLLNSANELVL